MCILLLGETGNAEVIYHQLDLSDTNSIREFASHIYNTEQRLDILINNAGKNTTHLENIHE